MVDAIRSVTEVAEIDVKNTFNSAGLLLRAPSATLESHKIFAGFLSAICGTICTFMTPKKERSVIILL